MPIFLAPSLPPEPVWLAAGAHELKVRATSNVGETQPMEPLWNGAGYLRNVVETVRVTAA